MKNPISRTLTSIAAGVAILAGSLLAAAPASASGGDLGAVGTVCVTGAGAGVQVKIAETLPTAVPTSTARTYDAAITAQTRFDSAGAAALTAQRDRNAAAGLSTTAVVEGSKITWRAVTGADGCAVVPAKGSATSVVSVAVGTKSGSVSYAPTVAFAPSVGIVWTEHATASSSKIVAVERDLTHRLAQAGRVGFAVNFTR